MQSFAGETLRFSSRFQPFRRFWESIFTGEKLTFVNQRPKSIRVVDQLIAFFPVALLSGGKCIKARPLTFDGHNNVSAPKLVVSTRPKQREILQRDAQPSWGDCGS